MRLIPLAALAAVVAACSTPGPPARKLRLKFLYLNEAGRVERYDEVVCAVERRVTDAVRGECDALYTKYAFTVHEGAPGEFWASL